MCTYLDIVLCVQALDEVGEATKEAVSCSSLKRQRRHVHFSMAINRENFKYKTMILYI